VINFSGTQYKVTRDDVLVADKIPNVDIGDVFAIENVLLVGSRKTTVVGRPKVRE